MPARRVLPKPLSPPPANPALVEHVAEIRRLGTRVIGDLVEIGLRLTKCKKIVGHGRWLPWLKQEFDWSEDKAERLIALAAMRKQIPQIAEFQIPLSALYALARPSTPKEARDEIIKRAKAGEKITVTKVGRIIHGHQLPADLPKPKEANKLAAETRKAVLASDGNIYFGTSERDAQAGEDRRTIVYGIKRAVKSLSEMEMSPGAFPYVCVTASVVGRRGRN